MKLRQLFFIGFLAFSLHSFSQVTVSLGVYTGAGSTNVLLSTSTTTNRYSRTISLYSASEIMTAGGYAGTISSLAWDKGGTGEYITNDAYIKIYLKHVTDTIWSSVPDWNTAVVGATEVFTSSTFSIPTGTGWKTISFTTPFVWNGIDNIAVFVEWDRSSAPTGSINWGRSTTTDANATRVGSASLSALVLLINSSRPLLQLTITPGGVTPVYAVNVTTQGGVPAVINTNGGTLQMEASVIPGTVNQAVTWSMVNGSGLASISPTGLVTAIANGSVWAKAVSVQDSSKMDSLMISISNQIVPITSVVVSTIGGVPAVINTVAGTLQMVSSVVPVQANQTVTWSLVNGTGSATISPTGLVTAQTDGIVWAKATSVQDITKMDSLLITISNQGVGLQKWTQEAGMHIYPNPVHSGVLFVEIEGTKLTPNAQLSILDILGQLKRTEVIQFSKMDIKVGDLPSGIYILRFDDGSNQAIRKFVIE